MVDSENVKDLIKKAHNFKEDGEFEEALKILEKLNEENPTSKEVKRNLIDTLFAYGGYLNDVYTLKYEKAKEIFERIINIEPDNYRAHYNLGIAFFNLENLKNAETSFKKALEIKPDYQYCFYNLGLVFEENSQFEEALESYEKALEINPKFIYALTARSEVREKLDELKQKKVK